MQEGRCGLGNGGALGVLWSALLRWLHLSVLLASLK